MAPDTSVSVNQEKYCRRPPDLRLRLLMMYQSSQNRMIIGYIHEAIDGSPISCYTKRFADPETPRSPVSASTDFWVGT